MSDWIDLPPDDEIDNWHGFVYLIERTNTHLDDPANPEPSKYIGCKKFHSTTKKAPSKKSGLTRKKKVVKRSDYLTYYGSSNDLKESIKKHGKQNFKRTILRLCTCQWELKWWEMVEQTAHNVLLDDSYFNGILNLRIGKMPQKLRETYKNLKITVENNQTR